MKYILILLFSTVYLSNILSQGCSDAGICSVKPGFNEDNSSSKFHYSALQSVALGEQSIVHLATRAQIEWQQGSYQLQFSIPYLFHIYDGSQYNGFGDITILNKYSFAPDWKVLAGLKIPVNDANQTNSNNETLPMPLQTSLGTFDLIALLSKRFNKWTINIGWQHPLNQNKNSFTSNEFYPDFLTTNNFVRGDDLMAGADWKLNNKWHFSAVSVYRLNGDYANGEFISGSEGLSINLNAQYTKQLKNNLQLDFLAAAPILVRKVRPDGTTRSFIVSVALSGVL